MSSVHLQGILENFACTSSDPTEEQNNILEFLRLITPLHCAHAQQRLQMIKNGFVLRQKYDLQIAHATDLVLKQNRLKLLAEGIENILKRSKGLENICKYFMVEIGELSLALGFSKMFGAKRLCQRLKCLVLSCTMAFHFMEIVDCNTETRDDYIEMALELLCQQIYFTRNAQASSLASMLNDNDPLAYPLAYELLVRASLFESNRKKDLIELIKYVRIASNTYAPDAIETFYMARQQQLDKLIGDAIEASQTTADEDTLYSVSFSNNSFDVQPDTKVKKNRYSVSIFDDVVPATQQQTQNKVSCRQFENRFRAVL